MKNLSHGLRLFIDVILIFLFIIVLVVAIPVITASSTVTNQDNLKSWLSESDFYNNLYEHGFNLVEIEDPDSKSDEATRPLAELINEGNLFTADEIKTSLEKAIPPEFVRSSLESALDGLFDYLSGETETLTISIDLKDRAEPIANEVKALFGNRLAELPACDQNDLVRLDSEDFNLLTADCRPPGQNAQAEVDKFIDQLVGPEGPFGENLTTTDIDVDVKDNLDNARTGFQKFTQAPLLFGLVLLVLIGLIMLTSRPWYKAMKIAGISTTVVGLVFLALFSLGRSQIDSISINKIQNDFSQAQADAIENLLTPLGQQAAKDVGATGQLVSGLVAALGIGLFLFSHYLAKKHRVPKSKTILDDDFNPSKDDKDSDKPTEEPAEENREDTRSDKDSKAPEAKKPKADSKKKSS